MPRFSPGCVCCSCKPGTTTICGQVTACAGQAVVGATVQATGPDSLSTITDASGNYCFSIAKKGTYTVQVIATCGDSTTQTVNVTACGQNHTGVNFTLSYPTLTVTASGGCVSVTSANYVINGPGVSGGTCPPFLPGSLPSSFCATPSGVYTIEFCDSCYEPLTDSVTMGCTNTTHPITLTAKTYNYYATAWGCGPSPLKGATITISGTAGSWTGTTDSSGNFGPVPLLAQCDYQVTVSKSRYVTKTLPSPTTYFTQPCQDVDDRGTQRGNLILGPDTGYQCFGQCCDDPLTDPITITDEQGTHPLLFNGSTFQTACITAPASVVGSCASGFNCGNTSTGNVIYWYAASCSSGNWTVSRAVPFCDTLSGTAPLATQCSGSTVEVLDCISGTYVAGNPFATSESVTQASPIGTCGPLALGGFVFSQFFTTNATLNG